MTFFKITETFYDPIKNDEILDFMESKRAEIEAISGLEKVRIIETDEGKSTTVGIYKDEASASEAESTVQSLLGDLAPFLVAPPNRKGGLLAWSSGGGNPDNDRTAFFKITETRYDPEKKDDINAFMESKRAEIEAISGLEAVRVIDTDEGKSTLFARYKDEASASAAESTVQSLLGDLAPLMTAPPNRKGGPLTWLLDQTD